MGMKSRAALLDARTIVAALGEFEDSEEVQHILSTLGVEGLKRETGAAEADLYRHGLSLHFEVEDLKNNRSRLVFVSVYFFSKIESGFQSFAARLPEGLRFEQSRPEVHKLLGAPSETVKWLSTDHWDAGPNKMSVEFDDKTGAIKNVYVGR